jgi:hypothetical protein
MIFVDTVIVSFLQRITSAAVPLKSSWKFAWYRTNQDSFFPLAQTCLHRDYLWPPVSSRLECRAPPLECANTVGRSSCTPHAPLVFSVVDHTITWPLTTFHSSSSPPILLALLPSLLCPNCASWYDDLYLLKPPSLWNTFSHYWCAYFPVAWLK